MADRKISDLTALTTPASGDYLPIVDISETAAASKNKRITVEELFRGVPDGTAAAPSIAPETDPNTGLFFPAADTLAVSTGGSERARIDSLGNVGIGTSSPESPVHVVTEEEENTIFIECTNGRASYRLKATEGEETAEAQILLDPDGELRLENYSGEFSSENEGGITTINSGLLFLGAYDGAFAVNGHLASFSIGEDDGAVDVSISNTNLESSGVSVALWLSSVVLDNTALPADVGTALAFRCPTRGGGPGYAASIEVTNPLSDTVIGRAGAMAFKVRNGSTTTTAMNITETGRVGIGTSSPSCRLDVSDLSTEEGVTNRELRFRPWSGDWAGDEFNWQKGAQLALKGEQSASIAFFSTEAGTGGVPARVGNLYSGPNYTSLRAEAGHLRFDTRSGGENLERLRITSDGYLRMAASTGGIQFNGDTAAANALDDYEEGTWTPTGGTWSDKGGTYTKIGRTVIANGWANASGGQTLTLNEIGGLPFAYASYSSGTGSYIAFEGQGNPPTGATYLAQGSTMNIGTTSMKLYPTFSRTNSGTAGGDHIQFTVVYRV